MIAVWFVLALLTAQVIGLCYKRAGGLRGGPLFFNCLYTALCALGCGILLLFKGATVSFWTLIISVGAGVALSAAAILYIRALACGPFVISGALFSASSLLPVAYCAVYPGEPLSLWQYIGYLLLIACGFAMVYKKQRPQEEDKKVNGKWLVLLLSAGVINSIIPYGIRLQSQMAPNESIEMLFLYFGAACLTNLLLATREGCFRTGWKQHALGALPPAAIMAVSICLNTWVQSRIGAEHVSAIIQFCVLNACGMWLSVIIGRVLYSERLTWVQYVALAASIVSGMLISVI